VIKRLRDIEDRGERRRRERERERERETRDERNDVSRIKGKKQEVNIKIILMIK
jgi:hypothetical protein